MSGCLMAVTSHANRSTRSVFLSQSRFCFCWYFNYSFFSSSALYHKKSWCQFLFELFFWFWFSGLWDFLLDFWRYLGIERANGDPLVSKQLGFFFVLFIFSKILDFDILDLFSKFFWFLPDFVLIKFKFLPNFFFGFLSENVWICSCIFFLFLADFFLDYFLKCLDFFLKALNFFL